MDNNNIINSIYDLGYQGLSCQNSFDNCKTLGSSWINEYERLCNISSNQERELMSYIKFYFIYINKNNYIDKILFEKGNLEIDSENKFSFISKEALLKIIQSKKMKTPYSRYKLIDILSFVVDIEPENISIKNEFNDHVKVLSLFKDIRINKSIFIFHNINSIYFIFQEFENNLTNKNNRFTVRSILKKNGCSQNKLGARSTKKVRIMLPGENLHEEESSQNKHRISRKKHMS